MREQRRKTRKEIHREYQERVKPSGVFQIKNRANGKVLLGSSLNLEGMLNRHRFTLTFNGHPNKELQKDGTNWVLINSALKFWRLFKSLIIPASISRTN